MKIEIYDIDGTLTYAHGDIDDKTGFKSYAYWPLITENFTSDPKHLHKMIEEWDESMKTELDPTGSSHTMMQKGIETFKRDVTANDVRDFSREITLKFIDHGVVRPEAIEHMEKVARTGKTCILSTGSYQDGAYGFVDALVERKLITKKTSELLLISGATVDWDNNKLTHANVRERKLIGIESVMKMNIERLKSTIQAVYADDPWINDRDILSIVSSDRAYVIKTVKNKDKILPNGLTFSTWESIISGYSAINEI